MGRGARPPPARLPAQLAEDGWDGIGLEARADARVVARECLEEPDRPDLDEVVEWLAGVRVAARELPYERHVAVDQLRPRAFVAATTPAVEEGGLGVGAVLGRVHGDRRAAHQRD